MEPPIGAHDDISCVGRINPNAPELGRAHPLLVDDDVSAKVPAGLYLVGLADDPGHLPALDLCDLYQKRTDSARRAVNEHPAPTSDRT